MTEMPYNQQRMLLSLARQLKDDIQRHTESMQIALSFVNSERAESFHANEIVEDTIMLEMILEDFKGDIPEEFKPFQKEVSQRRKMYGDLFGDQWYENRRTALEEELAEAASVPEPSEKDLEYMKKEAGRFFPRHGRKEKQKEPEKPKITLELTGKIVQIYSLEAQEQLLNFEEDVAVHPLEAKLEPGDELFYDLPEHYTIICMEKDQQIKVDINETKLTNPFYKNDIKVSIALQNASESGKNLFRLQQLFERLVEEQYE